MSDDRSTHLSPTRLALIQPVVLVGGKSLRFGRDKLMERWAPEGRPLVERPIRALRAVFGPRVKVVGNCASEVAALADGVIPDGHPGIGPMGGIISALAHWNGPVFVLAGDMPSCNSETIECVLRAFAKNPSVSAVLASDVNVHPCVGCYRPGALPVLRSRLEQGEYTLRSALPPDAVALAACNPAALININSIEDLSAPRAFA